MPKHGPAAHGPGAYRLASEDVAAQAAGSAQAGLALAAALPESVVQRGHHHRGMLTLHFSPSPASSADLAVSAMALARSARIVYTLFVEPRG